MTQKQPLGVLILHGFTGSLDTVKGLVPTIEALQLPYRMPVLRGHGTRYEDLANVTPRDWVDDAEAAMRDLLGEVERVFVVGLSMGALVTLNLAMEHPREVAGVAVAGTFLRCANPLANLTPLLKLVFPYWDNPNAFADPEIAKTCTNYPKFPTATFARLQDFACQTERRLPEVKAPALILHSRKDQTADPISAKVLESKLGSKEKRVVWFERSGHEMLQDLEAPAVYAAIGSFIEGHARPAAAS